MPSPLHAFSRSQANLGSDDMVDAGDVCYIVCSGVGSGVMRLSLLPNRAVS